MKASLSSATSLNCAQIAGDLLPHKDEADRSEKIIATGNIAISRRFGSRDTDHILAIDERLQSSCS